VLKSIKNSYLNWNERIRKRSCSYVCKNVDCNQRFLELLALRRHKLNEHSEALFPFSFECPFCFPTVWFRFDYQLDDHIIRVHQGVKRCSICPVADCPNKYNGNPKLIKPLRREHPLFPIKESRATKFSYGTEHSDGSLMGLVPGDYKARQRWKIRSQTAGNPIRLPCPVSGCRTRCSTQLDMHHHRVHAATPTPLKCRGTGCTKVFKNSYRYHGHIGIKGNVTTSRLLELSHATEACQAGRALFPLPTLRTSLLCGGRL